MDDTGTGLDYGTKPTQMLGDITPNDRFFVRSHAPTPRIAGDTWTLHVDGDGVREPLSYSYAQLSDDFPLISIVRTLECAGNRRVLFGEEVHHTFEGTQWGRGAISTAEWTGIRLRDLLAPADIADDARERVRSLQRRYVGLWADRLRERHPALTPRRARAMAHATFGMLNSTPHSAVLPEAEMRDMLTRMALASLGV